MARTPKNGKTGETETTATTLILPSDKKLDTLIKLGRNTKKRAQSASGEFGDAVAKSVENDHLDRRAFAIARGLDAMDDERLHVTYHHLLDYLEKLGIAKRATAQGTMFDEEEKEETDDGKVHRLGTNASASARKVAEQAGAN